MLRRNLCCKGALYVALVSLLVVPSSVGADDEKPTQNISPQAEKVLRELAKRLQGAKTFRVELKVSTVMDAPGMKHTMHTAHELSFSRPDRLALVNTGGDLGNTIICDGKKVYAKQPVSGESGVMDAPKDRDLSSLTFTIGIAPAMGHDSIANEVVGALMAADPYDRLTDSAVPQEYLGMEDREGRQYHKITYPVQLAGGSCYMLIGKEAHVLAEVKSVSSEKLGDQEARFEGTVLFNNWKFNIDLPDDVFTLPPGSKSDARKGGQNKPLKGNE
jgi:outer membrane lipoprotein-sorting protein